VRSQSGIATPAELHQAQQAFAKMNTLAEELHKSDPADFRALCDRGIALMRLANVTTDSAEKLRRYTEARGYMRQAGQTSKDLVVQLNTAFVETRIGDILRQQGASGEANRHYRESMQMGERLIEADPKNTSARRTLMEDLRWLGEDAARRRASREAAEFQNRLLQVAEELRKQKDAPSLVQGNVAKAYVGVAAILALSGEKEAARDRYQSALAEFKRLQTLPGFSFRKDMQEAENALAQLR
jgi:tetratricopeptide (TPR) repeat protein